MFDDLMIICRKCGKKVHPSELRKENQNSDTMICNSCYVKAKDIDATMEQIKTVKPGNIQGVYQYFCEACGFKFTRNKEVFNKSCPYCSKENIRQVNVNIVKEIK
ncbi:MAG: hypothetical protein AABW58_01115 [Nanoarchaeota archaeon]